MNPIFQAIEKLINEHGSSVILKERLALADDQYSMLEQKFSDAKAKIVELEGVVVNLRADIKVKDDRIKTLEHAVGATMPPSQRLEEVRENILLLLARAPGLIDKHLSSELGIHIEVVLFHIKELEQMKYVCGLYAMGSSTQWSLAQAGRGYLIRHNLLS